MQTVIRDATSNKKARSITLAVRVEEAFQRRKHPVWVSWRMDETSIKVQGERCYLYHTADKQSQTIDFLLTEYRDKEAALRMLRWQDRPLPCPRC